MNRTPDDRVRGFPAFPATPRGRQFARTWWGKAWIKALEDTALALQPLKQGRRHAYAGRVGTITVSPGRLAATVDGGPDGSFRTVVSIAQLTDAEWTRFLDRVTARAGHLAALLDRDMPHDLVEAAEDAGIALLPGIGDLEPDCDCDDWELPCQHAASLCYQASWLLDADPFVLLLMRGRGERELLDELHVRNAPMPGQATDGIDADTVAALTAAAADRARRLLDTPRTPPLDRWQDTIRIGATRPSPQVAARLKASSKDRAGEFDRAVAAWSAGGADGLTVLDATWSPPAPELARARVAWLDAWEEETDAPALDVTENRCTVGGLGLQLRLGRDHRWYPFRDEAGTWWPSGHPDHDPAVVFSRQLG